MFTIHITFYLQNWWLPGVINKRTTPEVISNTVTHGTYPSFDIHEHFSEAVMTSLFDIV